MTALTTADYVFGAADEDEDVTTCTYVHNVGSYTNPPEPCDLDAIPGTDRCSMHNEDPMWEGDEDTHDYYED